MTGLELLREIAAELGTFREDMAFTGGLVLPLYFERPPSDRLRPTFDADAVVACSSYARWAGMQAQLMQLGIMPANEPNAPICRMKTPKGYLLDVMPMDPDVLGFGNRWFQPGYEQSIPYDLGEGLNIRIFPAALYAAAKAEAYRDRGKDDPWLSHDLEDFLTLLACRPSLLAEIEAADEELRAYLEAFARELLAMDRIDEVIDSHVRGDADEAQTALEAIVRGNGR
jgi:hypothetical protein